MTKLVESVCCALYPPHRRADFSRTLYIVACGCLSIGFSGIATAMSHLAAHPSTENFSRAFSRRLSELERIEPVPLADLFSLVNGDEPVLGELRNVLHASLLDRTIAHARQHTIFYASDPAYAEWTPRTDGRPSPLDGLPIVDRPLMASRLRDFLADDVHLRSICHTSGTTGLPLDVYKSFEEIAFINAFYTRLFEPFARLLTSRPLVLSFPNVHHGVPVPMPGIGLTFVGGVTEDGLIEDAIRILDTRYDIEGHDHKISIVSGLDHHLMLFTAALLDRGIEPRRFELNAINITGGFISTHWLRFLEDTWNCVVNDRFTLTESLEAHPA